MTYNIRKATALVTAGWVACAAMMTIGGAANAQSVLDSAFWPSGQGQIKEINPATKRHQIDQDFMIMIGHSFEYYFAKHIAWYCRRTANQPKD